jgi:DNA-binding transcriptional MocR family regulator
VPTYRDLADAVQRDIEDGRLHPGNRLPTQREFAETHGVAPSTATRVFTELIRRGLVTGEVGRGTYVRSGRPMPGHSLAQSVGERVNLAVNVPLLTGQARLLARASAEATRRPRVIDAAMDIITPAGSPLARRTIAGFVARGPWRPEPDGVCVTGNGRQALAATLTALVPSGQRLGIDVVPIGLDDHGLSPRALLAAHRRTPLRALYVQPTLHNPLGITMPVVRRQQLVRVLEHTGIVAIEDHVYAFLVDDPAPLASLSDRHVVMIDSLSKRVAPGMSLGWVVAPAHLHGAVTESIRAGGLAPSGLALELGVRWLADGTVAHLIRDKRRDAVARQRVMRRQCHSFTVQADPRAYHAWLALPGTWRAEAFTSAAAARGIAVAPASAFAVGSGHAPNAIRVALASPPPKVLAASLGTLDALARLGPRGEPLE